MTGKHKLLSLDLTQYIPADILFISDASWLLLLDSGTGKVW